MCRTVVLACRAVVHMCCAVVHMCGLLFAFLLDGPVADAVCVVVVKPLEQGWPL